MYEKYDVLYIMFIFRYWSITSTEKWHLLTNSVISFSIVEIYYNSTWDSICNDNYFDYNEANVKCHQLAFTVSQVYDYAGSITM